MKNQHNFLKRCVLGTGDRMTNRMTRFLVGKTDQ